MIKIKNTLSFLLQLFLLVGAYIGYEFFINKSIDKSNIINFSSIMLLITWLLSVWLTHKYKPKYYQLKWIYVIAPFWKAAIFQIIFIFLISLFDRKSLIGNNIYLVVLLYIFTELIIYSIIIIISSSRIQKRPSSNNDITKYQQESLKIEKEIILNIDLSIVDSTTDLFNTDIINNLYEFKESNKKENPELKIIKSEKELISNKNKYQVCFLDKRINDIHNINCFLGKIYDITESGGYVFASFKDLDDFENEYFATLSKIIKLIKKIHYYVYHRALPKISYLNYIYKIISGGRNKVLSFTEICGRFFYCGFDVIKHIKISGITYILVKKSFTVSENPNPSFNPVITLNRVSLYGNIIKIHKIRSMYPYSEFLQKKVFEEGNMQSMGKFEQDYRITKIGSFIRKYWIDELPQFFDWFRGKIKLVGIRAMSQHYFSLYPKEYQELYFKVKPGIISPIFDEKTDGFEDIVRIEQEYLEDFLKQPVKTDLRYFFLTMSHIFKGVRSK